ncbi:MAG: SagB/ThcOx family dehydrogenase [Anaerolineae bacterium]|nr:SagB/ThcOx family dehydrogenase [Anaerolineae bacterium]
MDESIGKAFIERTKHHHLPPSDQMRGLPQPPVEQPYDRSRSTIALPDPAMCPSSEISVRDAIRQRRSVRSYARAPLALVELSYLLWCTQGVKEVLTQPVTLRTVPSAGARHAFETYVLANRVTDIQPGLYRYGAIAHELVVHDTDPGIAEAVTAAAFGQRFVMTSAATLIWTAIPYRMNWRYGERGYRYLHLDAGHVCQNLYLGAESIGCGVCAIAAYDDDHMNQLLGVDGESAFTIYLATVGKKTA